MDYRSRAVDGVLVELLSVMGAVLIEGPRACGKSSAALQQAQSSIRLDQSPELIQLAELDPHALLQGEIPRLIDEWQLAPSLWNSIRHEIDDRQARGGWPGLLEASTRQAVIFNRSYCDDLCNTEIPAALGVRHDSSRLRRLLESISRNISGEATMQSLAHDVAGSGSAVDPKQLRHILTH
ncbi:MAG: hypothetical protein ACRCWS_08900 [Propionibacteriaceae bacterium]